MFLLKGYLNHVEFKFQLNLQKTKTILMWKMNA